MSDTEQREREQAAIDSLLSGGERVSKGWYRGTPSLVSRAWHWLQTRWQQNFDGGE